MRTSTVLNSNSNSRSSDTQQEFGKRGVVKRSFSRTTRGVELVWSGTRRRWPAAEAHLVMEIMWRSGRWDGRFSFTRSGAGCEPQTGWAWDRKGPWSPSDGCVPFHTQQLTCPGSHSKEGTNWGPKPVSCPPSVSSHALPQLWIRVEARHFPSDRAVSENTRGSRDSWDIRWPKNVCSQYAGHSVDF